MIGLDGPLFVHSDIARGITMAKRAGARIDPGAVQRSLIDFLAAQVHGDTDSLIFPAFNYDYGATRIFNVESDPVQVGALPEWLRQQSDIQRSFVPFFSVLSRQHLGLSIEGQINPFGTESIFQWLVDHDGTLALFGTSFNYLTFIHYVEEISGGPVYRYEKAFPGKISHSGTIRAIDFVMHVRPKGVRMNYDWPRLEEDLRKRGLLKSADTLPELQWVKALDLQEYWANCLASDPFHFLDAQSRKIFEIATIGGQYRVQQKDFENV